MNNMASETSNGPSCSRKEPQSILQRPLQQALHSCRSDEIMRHMRQYATLNNKNTQQVILHVCCSYTETRDQLHVFYMLCPPVHWDLLWEIPYWYPLNRNRTRAWSERRFWSNFVRTRRTIRTH